MSAKVRGRPLLHAERMSVRVTVRLPANLVSKLQKKVKDDDTSMSEICRKALESYRG